MRYKKTQEFLFFKAPFPRVVTNKNCSKVLIPEASSPRCKCNQLTLHGAGAASSKPDTKCLGGWCFAFLQKVGTVFSSHKKRVLIYQES